MGKRKQPEREVQRAVIRAARDMGFAVDDMSQPRASMMPRGLPDLRLRHPAWNLRLWCEVKAGKGKLSAHQQAWHALERECGGKVITVWSVEDLVQGLIDCGAPINTERREVA